MGNSSADQTVDDDLLAADKAAIEAEEVTTYDEADLERLTDAEREALTGGDEDSDETEAEAQPEQQPEQDAPAEPTVTADHYKAALETGNTGLADHLRSLQDKYDDGEISREELDAAIAESLQQATARTQQTAIQAAEDARWADACRTYVAANPQLIAPEHRDGFNAEVYAVTSDPRFSNLSFEKQLDLAAKRYALTPEGAALATTAQEPQPSHKPARQPAPLASKPVPTLADIPAETIDPNLSNVAALAARIDREDDPEARERILASMPEHLRDQVLSYGG